MLTHGVKYGAGTSIFESASKDSYFQLRFLVTSILINDLESRKYWDAILVTKTYDLTCSMCNKTLCSHPTLCWTFTLSTYSCRKKMKMFFLTVNIVCIEADIVDGRVVFCFP